MPFTYFRQLVELDPTSSQGQHKIVSWRDGYQIHPHVSIRIIGPPACSHQRPSPFTMAAAMLAPTPPTSPPSTFEEFLSIAMNDHYYGNYPALMQNFAIDGATTAVTPAIVQAQVVKATAQRPT